MRRTTINRRWYWSALLAAGVILLGLASRRYPALFPAQLGKYPGDALWTVLVYILWGIALPRTRPAAIALLALATSFAVEFGQLYQAPWIQAIRHTALGHLVLGSAFNWPDLLAYAVGAGLACGIERAILRNC